MIEQLTSLMQPIVVEYGAFGVFLGTLLEEVVAPIPSPLVPLMSGFFLLPANGTLLTSAWLALFTIALPVAVGVVLGSLVVYGLGYLGGKPFIEKNKRWLGLDWKDLEKVEKKLIRGSGDEIILFTLRALPIVPGVAVSGLCGVVRYPIKTFIVVTFFGALTRALVLGVVGWYVGGTYTVYSETISKGEKYIFVLIVILTVFLLGRLYYKKRSKKQDK